MRWFARRPGRIVVDPIDRVDPASLEIVEVDGLGRLHGPPEERSEPGAPEIGYARREPDPTSLAGVWEAIARA
jgi:hypothetical protein